MTAAPDYITLAEAAAQIGVCVNTVRDRVFSSAVPIRMLKDDRIVRIHRDDWLEYLRQRTVVLCAAPARKHGAGTPSEAEMQALLRRKAS